MTEAASLGFDVGGHGVRGALVCAAGQVREWRELPIDGADGRGVSAVEERIARIAAELDPDGALPAGIGLPGFFDRRAGVLVASPNFPEWVDVTVSARLRGLLGRPVEVDNDANCAALGEAWAGAAAGLQDVLLVTLGTGVGTGILSGGRMVRGHRGAAGEGGHVVIHPGGRRCGCGRRGCLEAYASGPGLVLSAGEEWAASPDGDAPLSAAAVFEADAAGAAFAGRAIERWCGDLAAGLATLVHVLSPEAIVLGGGVAGAWDRFAGLLERELLGAAIPACLGSALPLRRAALGRRAGAVGAAGLALDPR